MIIQGNIFENKQFVLDLPVRCSFKIKHQLKQKIVGQKGVISYIVNKGSYYVIRDKTDDNETYRSQRAKKYGVPLVSFDFVDDCIEANEIVDHKKYFPECLKAKVKKDFNDGKIQIQNDEMDGKGGRTPTFRFSTVKVFQYKDENGPAFHYHEHAIAKAILLRGKKKKNKIPFCVMEIHVSTANDIEGISKYCVFTHNGAVSSEKQENVNKQCRYFNDINETMLAYNHLYKQYTSPPVSMTLSKKLIDKNLGSDLFLPNEWLQGPISLETEIKSLTNHIWTEATSRIEDILSVSLQSLSLEKTETAKMLLWKILCNFQQGKEDETKLWNEFYEILPHKHQNELKTVAEIKEKFLDCQLISDMLAANESLENGSKNTIELKYLALHCNIETLASDNAEYQNIISQFVKNNSVIVDNIYKVNHYEDSLEYDNSVGNEKLLLHPTKVQDLIGLLSRGLSHFDECYVHASDDLTHRTTAPTEIYFVDTFEACLKYSPPSHSYGTRMIMINQVALGNSNQAFLQPLLQFGGEALGREASCRTKPLPCDMELEQADGTAWMAFFCIIMLDIALELAIHDPVYEDMASKFFEHFVFIVDAINTVGQGGGLWHEEDGFYYDYIRTKDGQSIPLCIRSLVGIVPIFSCLVLSKERLQKLKAFSKRTEWFVKNRDDLAEKISYMTVSMENQYLLAVPNKEQLVRILKYLLDENEFLSPYGIRSLSKIHQTKPFELTLPGHQETFRVDYVPGESVTNLFGGNSNWRGPVWFCMNFIIIEVLRRYHYYYGSTLQVECPTNSGKFMTLDKVSQELSNRLIKLFLPDSKGFRPCHGIDEKYAKDPAWKDLILFYEYFHGDSGRGCGASHQTGWTALVLNCMMMNQKEN